MPDNKTTDGEYDRFFNDAHQAGSERHGVLWLQANEFVCLKAMRMGIAATTKKNRAMLSVITLSALDSAKRYYADILAPPADAPSADDKERARELVRKAAHDAASVPCDCEDLWCVHWEDIVADRIAAALTSQVAAEKEKLRAVVFDYQHMNTKKFYQKYGTNDAVVAFDNALESARTADI